MPAELFQGLYDVSKVYLVRAAAQAMQHNHHGRGIFSTHVLPIFFTKDRRARRQAPIVRMTSRNDKIYSKRSSVPLILGFKYLSLVMYGHIGAFNGRPTRLQVSVSEQRIQATRRRRRLADLEQRSVSNLHIRFACVEASLGLVEVHLLVLLHGTLIVDVLYTQFRSPEAL